MLKGEKKIDWGFAEILAYASIVEAGSRIRIVGVRIQAVVLSSTAMLYCTIRTMRPPTHHWNISATHKVHSRCTT